MCFQCVTRLMMFSMLWLEYLLSKFCICRKNIYITIGSIKKIKIWFSIIFVMQTRFEALVFIHSIRMGDWGQRLFNILSADASLMK